MINNVFLHNFFLFLDSKIGIFFSEKTWKKKFSKNLKLVWNQKEEKKKNLHMEWYKWIYYNQLFVRFG
jgi:hypothetical protein